MSDLIKLEKQVLVEIAEPGSQRGFIWDGVAGFALECLRVDGLVSRGPGLRITDKGRAALSEDTE